MSEAGAPDLPRWAKATLAALVAATLVVSCLPALSWGLWQDETTMAWQAEAGWAIARDRLGDPAQSVLFGYIEALFYFPGPHMEAWLRAPAVIGTLASLFLVYRLAEMFVGKGSGLLALVPLAASPLILTYSTAGAPVYAGAGGVPGHAVGCRALARDAQLAARPDVRGRVRGGRPPAVPVRRVCRRARFPRLARTRAANNRSPGCNWRRGRLSPRC